MEDIVKRLRTQVTNRSQVAYDAAEEIESLRAQLAELKDERNALEERYECNTAIMHARTEKMNAYYEQLLATQARAARLVEALKIAQDFCSGFTAEECPDKVAIPINEALSTPINLDALY